MLPLVLLLELLFDRAKSERYIRVGLARAHSYLRVGNHMTTSSHGQTYTNWDFLRLRVGNHMTTSSHGPTYTNCDVLRVELHRSPRSNPHPSRDSWLGFA